MLTDAHVHYLVTLTSSSLQSLFWLPVSVLRCGSLVITVYERRGVLIHAICVHPSMNSRMYVSESDI
jgi:hypothetical protein